MTKINYTELREKIDSVAPDEMAKVLADAGFVHVAFDQERHPDIDFNELDEATKVGFIALDTAYSILGEAAVKVVLAAIRESADGDLPSDEELFEESRQSGIEGAPTSYRDLAPSSMHAARHLSSAFDLLVEQAEDDAFLGLSMGGGAE